MAIIPDIHLSDRRLGVLGPIRMKPVADVTRSYDAAGKAVGAGLGGLADAAGAYFRIKAKQELDNGDLAAVDFENGWRRIHNGYVDYDQYGNPTKVKGLVELGPHDYEDGQNALTKLRDYEQTFRESDAYRKLGREGRERFDLRVRSARQRAMEQANSLFDRNAKVVMEEGLRKQVECQNDRAKDFFLYHDNEEVDGVFSDAANRIAAAKCKPSIIDDSALDEERLDVGKLSFVDEKNGEVGGSGSFRDLHAKAAKVEEDRLRGERLTAILEAGIAGNIPNESALAMAGEYVDFLEGKGVEQKTMPDGSIKVDVTESSPRISAELANKMRATIEKYGEKFASGVSSRAVEARSRGDLSEMDRMSQELFDSSNALPEGSRARAMLAKQHADMDEACDKLASYEVMRMLGKAASDGRYVPGVDTDAKTYQTAWDMDMSARHRKVFDETRRAFDESWLKRKAASDNAQRIARDRAFRQQRDANVLQLRTLAFRFASQGDYFGYVQALQSAVVNGRIAGHDFERLSEEFENGWAKGYKGHGEQKPPQQIVMEGAMNVVTDVFGENALDDLARDKDGAVRTNGDGRLSLDRKIDEGQYRFLTYDSGGWETGRRTVEGGFKAGPYPIYDPPTVVTDYAPVTRETITPQQKVDLLNQVIGLSRMNGMSVTYDVFGKPLGNGADGRPKTRKVDAVADFRVWCERFRTQTQVENAAKEIASRNAVATRMRTEYVARRVKDDAERTRTGVNLKETNDESGRTDEQP